MDSEEMEVESSSDVGPSSAMDMEEPSESGMGMESSEAMSADSSDAAHAHAPASAAAMAPESDCHVGQSSEGLVVFIPETSSSTDVHGGLHLPDSSSVAQSTSVSSVSTVTQSVLVSESAQVVVHSSAAVSDGGMMVSDSTASTSSDLGSAIDKIIESTIGPDIMNGCIAVTSAEDGSAETTQYLILQGPDDGAPMVAQMSSSALSSRIAIDALADGPTSTCLEQGDMGDAVQGSSSSSLDPDQPDQTGHSGYPEHEAGSSSSSSSSSSRPDQTAGEAHCSSDHPSRTRTRARPLSRFPHYGGGGEDDDSSEPLQSYAECSGTMDSSSHPHHSRHGRHGHSHSHSARYVVECSNGYIDCSPEGGSVDGGVGDDAEAGRPQNSRYDIDSSSAAVGRGGGSLVQRIAQYVKLVSTAGSEDDQQPGCSHHYRVHETSTTSSSMQPDQPAHGGGADDDSNGYIECSTGQGSLYADEGTASGSSPRQRSLADTVAGSSDLAYEAEAMECSESQAGTYISSSGTYTAQIEPEPEPEPEAEAVAVAQWSPGVSGGGGDGDGDGRERSEGVVQQQVEGSGVVLVEESGVVEGAGEGGEGGDGEGEGEGGGGDRGPDLAALEEMMEVVIVQQFKCKMCPYKSVSKDTLINHMRDRHFNKSPGALPKKRGPGRPRRAEAAMKQAAGVTVKVEEPAEEEEDDIVDAGAIDDREGDSDYSPAEQEHRRKQQAAAQSQSQGQGPSSCPSSSQDRPRRRVGRPKKFSYFYGSQEAEGVSKANGSVDTPGSEEASSSGLGNGTTPLANGTQAEPGVSQSDSENKDPSSNTGPKDGEFVTKKRGRPSRRFLRKKYKKYMNKNKYPLLRPHNCWICGSRFLSKEDLRFHIDSHEGNDPELFKCLQCNYRCKRWSSLKEHMFNHEGTKPYKCEECDYTSVYNKDVIRHSAVHNKEKKKKDKELEPKVSEFPCPICHRVYPMQKRLTQHMKTHSTEKPHVCDKCGKSFKKRYTFKMHLLTHIQTCGESRFKCEFCEYVCDNKKLLLNHQLSHTSDKPFKCDYCKYSTTKEDFLVSHLAIKHTGEKPFSCEQCHFTTKHRKNLRQHMRCKHPELYEEWSQNHPEEPVRRCRRPFFTLQQIEELKQQHEAQGLHNAIVAVDPVTLQAVQAIDNASVAQDAQGNTTIIYEQGSSDLSAQNALDLLLNMSNARELVGNSLQVVALKSDGKTLEPGTWVEAEEGAQVAGSLQPQKVVTFHVAENGETLVQEAFESSIGDAGGEITQIAIEGYEGAADFTVVEQAAEEMNSAETSYSAEEISADAQPVEVASDEVSDSGSVQEHKDKFYLSSSLSDGVMMQQVELSSESSGSQLVAGEQLCAKRFSCRICMESFHGRSDMENHKRAHVDSNTFKCLDCNYTATSWLEVKTHMDEHSDLRPHKCSSCSFASKNKKDLRRHMMTHTNEKPFTCDICGQRFNRKGHLKFHMDRLHSQEPPPSKKARQEAQQQQQTIIVNSDEEALATLQSLQAGQTVISPEQLQQALGQEHIIVAQEQALSDQALGQEHIIVAQEQALSDQEEATYIQQITTVDGQTVQHLMTADNQQVQYIISQDGVQHLIPQEYVVVSDGNHIQMPDGQIAQIQYEHDGAFLQEQQIALSHEGQIQYVPLNSEQQIVSPEELEAAAHSAVTAVADAAMAQVQTVYTEATAEQLEQLQQQGIHYDVITFAED